MGEPQRVFNLVSSPGFSINAHFATVPKRFKGEDITDTVLGTVGVAFCSVQGGALHVIFDVSSGNVTAYTSSDGHSGVHSREELISGTAAAALVRWGGAKMVHEQYICDLRWMDCSWMEANHDAPERTLPEVDSGHSRLLLRTSEVQVVISRQAMINLEAGGEATAIDCKRFVQWLAASSACNDLLRGTAPTEKREEWTLVLAMLSLDPSKHYFHFTQVDLPYVRHDQAEVHGLLGQRAIEIVKPPSGAPSQHAEHRHHGSEGATGKPEHALPAAASRMASDQNASGMAPERARSTLRAEDVHHARVSFGHQGEGAIVGHYSEYIVASLGEHTGFRFCRFGCSPSLQ